MIDVKLAVKLINAIPYGKGNLLNPWVEYCSDDLESNGPKEKIERLAKHLDCNPSFVLCGEANGYQGCRHSGIAFTSERLLLEGSIPRVEPPKTRLTIRERPFSEPSATIVWKALHRIGIAENTILWNALQMHPFKFEDIRSNRTPTDTELELGAPAMELLIETFPDAKYVAVGKKSEALLKKMGVPLAGAIRHPANGGATKFSKGLEELVG